ncbi:MAG: glycoside hydrolase family 95 protein [Parabacteroides sp.]|nr:glycoside hydrolase family 95 protein [Parabacteroides sp.]
MKIVISVLISCIWAFGLNAQPQHQDCVLWYKNPAKNWNEALPVGNGRLGAMFFGDFGRETIQLNEESLWAGSKSESNADAAIRLPEIQKLLLEGKIDEAVGMSEQYMKSDPLRIRSYQSFGDIHIDFFGGRYPNVEVRNYRRDLNLETGIASVVYEIEGVSYQRELFVSAEDDVVALRLSADKPGALTFRLQYSREQDAASYFISDHELGIKGQIFDLPEKGTGDTGWHMRFAGKIDGMNKGGTMKVLANGFYVEKADEVIFYFTAATDYNFSQLNYDRTIDPGKKCTDILNRIKEKSYGDIKRKHIEEHRQMFNRMSFNMGEKSLMPTDERLQRVKKGEKDLSLITLYFQYGRYLLMNSSRSPGILPANLQGIWNKDMYAAWNSDFHTNINIQMNYWPAEVCNLSETFMPFSNLITALRIPGRVTARKTYNSEGWTMNHVTDPFGRTAITDGVGWGTFPIVGAWLVLHQWEHFLFTGNKTYLEQDAYPAMKEAAEFILGYLVEDKNGYLVTAPSNSPENKYRLPNGKVYQLTYGATMDIEIIHELFNACLDAGKLIKSDPTFDKKLATVLKRLPPIRIGKRYDTIQEWIEDYEEVEPGHRHISHLFGLYPGKSISHQRKDLFEAARRTVERRRYYNENETNRQGTYTGWSRAWIINFYARLMDGEEAGKNVQMLLAQTTQSNLFNIHPPFQIDGNFGGTAGIAEMLIQSHNEGEIHLLPALPSFWRGGEIKGLCARNGIIVDMRWADGVLCSARFYSKEDRKVKVRYKEQVKTIRIKKNCVYDWQY